jgi:hypothetical protein
MTSATFIIWADVLISMLGGYDDEVPFFRIKEDILAARAKYAAVPRDSEERREAICEAAEAVDQFMVMMGDEDDARREKLKARYEALDDPDGKGWWYELRAQRDAPAKDAAGLLVEIDAYGRGKHAQGEWWVVDVQMASADVKEAMEEMISWLSSSNQVN